MPKMPARNARLTSSKARAHITIHGKVQGVFFRDFVNKTANALGIKGWVRNTPQGSVEIIAEGEKSKLEKLISECKKGPQYSSVEKVLIKWGKPTNQFNNFKIIY